MTKNTSMHYTPQTPRHNRPHVRFASPPRDRIRPTPTTPPPAPKRRRTRHAQQVYHAKQMRRIRQEWAELRARNERRYLDALKNYYPPHNTTRDGAVPTRHSAVPTCRGAVIVVIKSL